MIKYTPKKKKIFLKPNIVNARKPKTGVITHPKVVEALIKYFSRYEIVIGEGSIVGKNTKDVFEKTGYRSLAEKYGVELIDLNEAQRIEIPWEFGTIGIPTLLSTHAYVNVPTMKTHIVTKVTLASKNQKGLLKPADKMRFHKLGLHKAIREFARVVRPELTIVDAIICVEGDGPGLSGKRKKMNLIVGGTDMVEVDNVCCEIMGFDVGEVEHIPYVSTNRVFGEQIASVRQPFIRARSYHKRFNVYYHPFDGCSGCTNSVGDAVRSVRSPIGLMRLLYWGTLRRLDFVAGRYPSIPEGAIKIVCIGNCASEFAKKNNLPLIMGCPPSPIDIRSAI